MGDARGIRPEWPVWYQPENPLGAAVRYLASLLPRAERVSISLRKGKRWVRGPEFGVGVIRPASSLAVLEIPIVDRCGVQLGKVDIQVHNPPGWSSVEETLARTVAKELGVLWRE